MVRRMAAVGLGLGLAWLAGCQPKAAKPQAPVAAPAVPATAAAVPAAAVPPVPPRRAEAGLLAADQTEYDFGEIEPGQTAKGQFTLSNRGKEALRVEQDKIHVDCGCTRPKLEKTELRPGEKGGLEVELTAPLTPGPVTKRIIVYPEAPALPEQLELRITAKVRRFVQMTPEQLEFKVKQGAGETFTVTVESLDGTAFQVLDVSPPVAGLTYAFDRAATATKHEVRIQTDPAKLPRTVSGVLRLRITHRKVTELLLQYTVTAPFTTYPSVKRFTRVEKGCTETETIDVASNFGEAFELGEATSESRLMEVVETTKRPEGYRLTVRMRAPADGAATRFRDYLIINIKDRPQDTLRVLCYYLP